MKITPFAISGLLAGLFSVGFGFLVLFKSANKKLGRIWWLFSMSAAGWGFGCLWIGISNTPEMALWAWRFAYGAGVIWIPTFFLHFICIFCEIERPKMLTFQYLFSAVFSLVVLTDYFYYSPKLLFGSLYFPRHTPVYTMFVVCWQFFVFYSHWELWRAFKRSSSMKRVQIKYFFLATAIGFFGGSLVYLPNFDIEIYPWGNFTVFLYPIIMSYAIIRFNLMDIRLLVRRTALILLVYVGLLLISAPILYLFHVNTEGVRSVWSQSFEILLVSLVLSTGPFLYAMVVKRNSYFQEYTLAGLTHELKSPLAIIESALDFLNNVPDVSKLNSEQLTSYLQMIQRNSTRLQGFVNDLLQVFHPQSKDVSLEPEFVDLIPSTLKVIEQYRPLADQKGLKLKAEFDSTQTLKVHCDPQKIEQVISNLISNALKFSEQGTISVEIHSRKDEVALSITDEGLGVPQHEIPYVFDRFFQGKRGRSRKGTGIGLTIAKLWVEAHHGKIWAESEGEGRGTKVTFTLPA